MHQDYLRVSAIQYASVRRRALAMGRENCMGASRGLWRTCATYSLAYSFWCDALTSICLLVLFTETYEMVKLALLDD